MNYFDWDEEKNQKLKEEREISFQEVVDAINSGGFLEPIDNPNQKKYPNQKIMNVKIGDYVYMVPFVVSDEKFFLKSIFSSRKATKKYLMKGGKS